MTRYDIALGKVSPPENKALTDEKGRITKISKGMHTGHSVCNKCGKDMPGCWEVVCYKCSKTFCYKCSLNLNGLWYCFNCSMPAGKRPLKDDLGYVYDPASGRYKLTTRSYLKGFLKILWLK
jgi:hypothetical protein